MTYYESAEDVFIDRQRVIKELQDHGIDYQGFETFLAEVKPLKNEDVWHAQAVLAWLGY